MSGMTASTESEIAPETLSNRELPDADVLRANIRSAYLADEGPLVRELTTIAALTGDEQHAIATMATELVTDVRALGPPDFLNGFLAEYGLSSDEGVALLALAEALLRVPDARTTDELIADKITAGDWRAHLGRSDVRLVNMASRALLATRHLLATEARGDRRGVLQALLQPVVRPIIRFAVRQGMRRLADRYVFATTVDEALARAPQAEAKGFTHSYDMLGEGARNSKDAMRFFGDCMNLAHRLSSQAHSDNFRDNPGISIKLSALHPRYEYSKHASVVGELGERVRELCRLAAASNMGLNIDGEEANRLELYLDIVDYVLADPQLAEWPGLGIIVQAYGRRALPLIEWTAATARRRKCPLMVRLVKGAYWDTEIKHAQVLGIEGFPVLTRKANTDVSYIACARQLLQEGDWIYPQFGTHNAHTAAMILRLAGTKSDFEFQRIHGMGEGLHEVARQRYGTRCRIYEAVGSYHDLLAYFARRLLENGANSSFVYQLTDARVPTATVVRDPLQAVQANGDRASHPKIARPDQLFSPARQNSRGWDTSDPNAVHELEQRRAEFQARQWLAGPTLAADPNTKPRPTRTVLNPARPDDVVGQVTEATGTDAEAAFATAAQGFHEWGSVAAAERAVVLERIADQYEANTPELLAVLAREAGKTWSDAIDEIREAVDFCRFYAGEVRRYAALGRERGRGVFVCISPWNFPLAIFTGQISAALGAGNAVIAKPAEQSSLTAARTAALMHAAGVPANALQLLPGSGEKIGGALVADARVAGVCFTGSTETAQHINRAMADAAPVDAPLIAETGGINAAIVDSTVLPEQATDALIASAFQSAGQRCSAARILYVQRDIADSFLQMFYGAVDELKVGDPWQLATDVGPLIDAEAKATIHGYCTERSKQPRSARSWYAPDDGHFLGPTVVPVGSIADVDREVFGPVLHVATYHADQLDAVVNQINAHGYGLTLSIHSRIRSRIDRVIARAKVGNIYVNRNQIGAVVGSQPFGGEALSGTGPKAGGPHYLDRFLTAPTGAQTHPTATSALPPTATGSVEIARAVQDLVSRPRSTSTPVDVCNKLDALLAKLYGSGSFPEEEVVLADLRQVSMEPMELPGPTGERNTLTLHPRGVFLCLGALGATGDSAVRAVVSQALHVLAVGNSAVLVATGAERLAGLVADLSVPAAVISGSPPEPAELTSCPQVAGVCIDGTDVEVRPYRQALAKRDGPILPLVTGKPSLTQLVLERAVCEDTAAAGGNASLVVAASE